MELGIPDEAVARVLKLLDAEGLLAALDRAAGADVDCGQPPECRQAMEAAELTQLKQLVDRLRAAGQPARPDGKPAGPDGEGDAKLSGPAAAAAIVGRLAAIVADLAKHLGPS